MSKPLSKRAQAKLRAEANRLKRLEAAHRLDRARKDASEAEAKLPPEWQAWGTTRVRAWDRYAQFVRQQSGLVEAKAERLEAVTAKLRNIGAWPLDECQRVAETPLTHNPD